MSVPKGCSAAGPRNLACGARHSERNPAAASRAWALACRTVSGMVGFFDSRCRLCDAHHRSPPAQDVDSWCREWLVLSQSLHQWRSLWNPLCTRHPCGASLANTLVDLAPSAAPLSLPGQTALGLAMTNAHCCGVISLGPMRPAVFSTRYLRGSWQTPRGSVPPPWADLVLRMHGFQSRQHRQPGDPVSAGEPVGLQE